MAEIIDIRPIIRERERERCRLEIARTCQKCIFWVPPELSKDLTRIVKDSRCGHPGGYTVTILGYDRVICNEFKRKRRDTNGEV